MSDLSPESGRWLLRAARHAIAERLGAVAPPPGPPPEELRQERGLFVTLATRPNDELRGCIGFVAPRGPLVTSIVEAAQAAAFNDPRFDPVASGEFASLTFEVSVLSPPAPIPVDDVVVGTHGLIVRRAGRSGLLLPQVPVEYGWDRETFLGHTCRKAGLAAEAWRETDVELLGFTAQVFHEGE